MSELENGAMLVEIKLTEVGTKINKPHQRVDNQENRLGRCNFCFVGLPEGIKGMCPEDFLETLLINTISKERFLVIFAFERA